jgi:endonuclease YncB( thermonuclease family)
MPFKVIKGTFHVRNYSPDGDSIRFQPDKIKLVQDLTGGRPRLNARNHVQLRIEAIDTLETHYNPPSGGGTLHQPLELAHAAVDKLIEFVGIRDVEWDRTHLTVTDAQDGTRGYILARTVEKYGRPVAFVYAGDPPEKDGAEVILDVERLRDSYNYLAIAEGLAYPTYYRGLFSDLRDALTAAVKNARKEGLGIHQADKTNDGFKASSLRSITEQHPILPKLFRRLSEYMVNYGTAKGFKKKLAQSREPVLDLKTSNFTHFDTFIKEDSGPKIKLTRLPEELVFDEMPTPSSAFSSLMDSEMTVPLRSSATVILPEEAVQNFSV